MRIASSIATVRDFFQQERRIYNPRRTAEKEIQAINLGLRELMEDNLDQNDAGLRAIYLDISSDRLEKFSNNMSYTDSTELVRSEVEGSMPDASFEKECRDGSTVIIKQPVKQMDLQLAEINQSNFYQYVMVNALDWMYSKLKPDARRLEADVEAGLIGAYNELNSEDLFYNRSAFESRVSTGSIYLSNIVTVVNRVLRVFLKEKARLQIQIDRLKEIDYKNAVDEQKTSFIMNRLSEENATYYGSITLGGDTASGHGDSWTCGECGEQGVSDSPIISIGSQVFTSGLQQEDIRGNLHFAIHRCDKCGKYNIVPGIFMTTLESLIYERNMALPVDNKHRRAGTVMGVGQGIIDQVLDEIQTRATSAESNDAREMYTEELESMTSFHNSKKELPRSIIDFEDIKDDIRDIMQDALTRVDECYTDYNETIQFVDTAKAKTEASDAISSFTEVYGDRLITREDGCIALGPSKLFIQFAGTILESWTEFGYLPRDVISTLCGIDAPYHNKLIQHKNMTVLLTATEKLFVYLHSIGVNIGTNYVITLDRLESLYRKILELPYNLYDILGEGYEVIRDIRVGLDLGAVSQEEYEKYSSKALLTDLLTDLSEMGLDAALYSRCMTKVDRFCEEYDAMQYGRLKRMRTAKTILLEVFCEEAANRLREEIRKLEDELISDMSDYVMTNQTPIYVASDVAIDSPDNFLSEEFSRAIVSRVYMPMIKATLKEAKLEDIFAIGISSSNDTFKNYKAVASRIRRVFSKLSQPEGVRDMYCTINRAYVTDSFVDGCWMTPVVGAEPAKCSLNPKEASDFSVMAVGSFCDYINAFVDIDSFELATYMSGELLDSVELGSEGVAAINRVLALISCVPDADDSVRNDMLAYVQFKGGEATEYLDLGVECSLWETPSNDTFIDEDELVGLQDRQSTAIDSLILFYTGVMPDSLCKELRWDYDNSGGWSE